MFKSSRYFITSLIFATVPLAAACHHRDSSSLPPTNEADTAANGARTADKDLQESREQQAVQTGTDGVEVGSAVADKARADSIFIDQRNTVVSQSRANLVALDEKIADLKARPGKARKPKELQARLDGLIAAKATADSQVEAVAHATPESWEIQRGALEDAMKAVDEAYAAAEDAAPAAPAPHEDMRRLR